MSRVTVSLILVLLLAEPAVGGQEVGAVPAAGIDLPFPIDGPPPPVPPAVVARDASGRVTVRAVRLTAPLRIDGRLDEEVYATVPAMSDFIQNDPVEGAPATQKTEVWVFFDDDHVYVVGRCWESNLERMIATEMRRDGAIPRNDNFAWSFDTFYDRRNAILFEVSPLGGRIDAQVTNERQISANWNPVWKLDVGRFDGGWTVEAALPFKSLRYRPGRAQIWGFQARRKNLWKNEMSFLTPVPRAVAGQGHFRSSLSATLVGLEAPPQSLGLEFKPYAIGDLASDATSSPRISNDLGGDVGLDVKYAVTQNLTVDITYNTDFAQVEADDQQINLTRFNLFFPEKREFFLENQGTFSFGGPGDINLPILFHSRQIGLSQGRPVPIQIGGRLTGRLGPFTLGLLSTRTDEEPVLASPPTTFSAVRIKRDILRKSSVGVIFTRRSARQTGPGTNEAYGIDASFGFFDNLTFDTYWAQTRTVNSSGQDTSYRLNADYAGDLYGIQLGLLSRICG